jgi:hypothetical protein
MALHVAEYAAAQTQTVLVAGVSGKRIVVTRLLASVENTTQVRLLSAPGEAREALILSQVFGAANTVTDLHLGPESGLATGSGEALGFTSVIAVGSKNHGLMVWYEVVG